MSFTKLPEKQIIQPDNLLIQRTKNTNNKQPQLNDEVLESNSKEKQKGNSLYKAKNKQRTRVKTQVWNADDIKKIFTLYNQYGSQWRIIQSQFPDRSANSIKNRYYTTIRILLKQLFKFNPQIKNKIPHQIPSKLILKFYQGRQEFIEYKSLAKKILKRIKYDLESPEIKKISQQISKQIKAVYDLIFERAEAQIQKISKSPQIIQNQKIQQNNQKMIQNNHQQKIKANLNINPENQANLHNNQITNQMTNQTGNQIYFIPISNIYNLSIIHTYFPNF